jgi:hypothetical protein
MMDLAQELNSMETNTMQISTTTKTPTPRRTLTAPKTDSSAKRSAGEIATDIVYKSSRFAAGTVGAAAGVVVGAPFGGFKGAVSEGNQLAPKTVSRLRTAGAFIATGAALYAAYSGMGAQIGLSPVASYATAALAGPVAGSLVTSAAIGLGEGVVGGLAGTVEGSINFAKSGAKSGTQAVDWIVNK